MGNTLDLQLGSWVAGGAARLLWHNTLAPLQKLTKNRIDGHHDIDVFSIDHVQVKELITQVRDQYHPGSAPDQLDLFSMAVSMVGSSDDIFETDNAISFNNCLMDEHYYTIQVIKKPRSSLRELFDSFDLINCQYATDGRWVVATQAALESWYEKKLAFNPHCNQELNLSRMVKYLSYDLAPNKELTRSILKSAVYGRDNGVFDDY